VVLVTPLTVAVTQEVVAEYDGGGDDGGGAGLQAVVHQPATADIGTALNKARAKIKLRIFGFLCEKKDSGCLGSGRGQ
jgi:hypothetical protein